MTEATPPLFELVAARIDREGVPLLESIDTGALGPRIALLGDWTALFDLLVNQASLVSGSARINGCAVSTAIAEGVVGVVRRELLLPRTWTTTRYLEESGLLLGMQKGDARDTTRGVVAMLGLGEIANKKLGALQPHEQRAASIARARLGEPAVLALEAPLFGADAELSFLLELIERATAGRASIISHDDTNPSGPAALLADGANDVLVLERGTLVGSLRAERFLVSVTNNARAFAEALGRDGLVVHVAGALRFVVETASSEAILGASLATNAPVVELLPLGTRNP